MRKILERSLAFIVAVSLVLPGCSHAPRLEFEGERNPAGGEGPRIYRYHGLLKAPPFQFLLDFAARKGIRYYLKGLPLDPAVHARLKENIESEKFSKFFVPFLLATKELYVASKKAKKDSFQTHIQKHFPNPKAYPGLEHKLFAYEGIKEEVANGSVHETGTSDDEVKPEPPKDSSPEGEMIASFITILDAILLQNPEFTLATPPARTTRTLDLAVGPTKKIMDGLIRATDPANASVPALEAMVSTPAKTRTTAAAVIDIIHYFAYKHYQMFAARYEAKSEKRAEYDREFKENPRALAKRLAKELKNRRYAAHIMVDGLEGHLTEALALGRGDSPFLQALDYEKRTHSERRPKRVPYRTLPETQDTFFDFWMKRGGFRHDAYLPFFRNLYLNHRDSIAVTGNATTPTISARNVPIIQTGAPVEGVGATHLVNMHFINRGEDRAYYFFGNDSFLQSQITSRAGMRTLPQRMPELDSLNCMGTVEAGYRSSIDPAINIALGEKMRDFGEILCMTELQRRGKNEIERTRLKRRFVELVKNGEGRTVRKENILDQLAELDNESIPPITTFFFPWLDHFSHFEGAYSDAMISPTGEMNRLDYWLGRFRKVYVDAGIYNRTLFAMAGDHGLTPVRYLLNPEKAVFGEMIKEGRSIKLNKISSDEGEGPKFTDPVHPPSQHGYDVVVASTAGGNFMVDLFLDQGANWSRQPVYNEIRNYRLMSGEVVDMIGESIRRLDDTLDYLVVRDSKCGVEGGAVRVVGMRNGKTVEAKITRQGDRVFYDSADDLLQVRVQSPYSVRPVTKAETEAQAAGVAKCVNRARANDPSTWCSEGEWRDLTSYSPRPDSVVQLSHIYDIEHAGTINLFPASYVGFNSIVPGRHAGESFMEKDAFVGYWGAPERTRRKKPLRSAVNGSIVPTLYEFLTGKPSGGAANGWGYPSLLER